MEYSDLIGKVLYNSSGYRIGKITGIVYYFVNQTGVECFEVGERGLEESPGRFWQCDRLNNGKLDSIFVEDF